MYLIVTHLDISNSMGLLNQFTLASHDVRWHDALHVLAYIKHASGQCHGHLCVKTYCNQAMGMIVVTKNLL